MCSQLLHAVSHVSYYFIELTNNKHKIGPNGTVCKSVQNFLPHADADVCRVSHR